MILSKLLKYILGITMYIWVFFFLTMKSPVLVLFPSTFIFFLSLFKHLAFSSLLDTVSMFQCWLFKKNVGTLFGHGSLGICVFFQLQSICRLRKESSSDKHSLCVEPQTESHLGAYFWNELCTVSVMWLWMPWGSLGKPVTRPRVVARWWSCCLGHSEGEKCKWGLFLNTRC